MPRDLDDLAANDPAANDTVARERALLDRLRAAVRFEQERSLRPAAWLVAEVDDEALARIIPGPEPVEIELPADGEELVLRDELGTVRARIDLLGPPLDAVRCDRGRLELSLRWPDLDGGPILAVVARGRIPQRLAAATSPAESGPVVPVGFTRLGAPHLDPDGLFTLEAWCDPRLSGRRVVVDVQGLGRFDGTVEPQGALRLMVDSPQRGRSGPVEPARIRVWLVEEDEG
ncbi:MAG: hypothetical protein D6798_11850 [Deltaproteobacteria bacterium]|nr:MAG: hypothetical protein D6798_11850 [Deltaproteobacteria bacterium]